MPKVQDDTAVAKWLYEKRLVHFEVDVLMNQYNIPSITTKLIHQVFPVDDPINFDVQYIRVSSEVPNVETLDRQMIQNEIERLQGERDRLVEGNQTLIKHIADLEKEIAHLKINEQRADIHIEQLEEAVKASDPGKNIATALGNIVADIEPPAVKRGRGRPRKIRTPEEPTGGDLRLTSDGQVVSVEPPPDETTPTEPPPLEE